eukprot:2929663-Pyramimonas_sp.AAC.1
MPSREPRGEGVAGGVALEIAMGVGATVGVVVGVAVEVSARGTPSLNNASPNLCVASRALAKLNRGGHASVTNARCPIAGL